MFVFMKKWENLVDTLSYYVSPDCTDIKGILSQPKSALTYVQYGHNVDS